MCAIYKKNEIYNAINTSKFFIVILSSEAINTRGYFHKEIKIALDIVRELPNNQVFIIPVRINDCNVEDDYFRNIHWVDMFNSYEKAIEKICDTIHYYSFSDEDNKEKRMSNILSVKKIENLTGKIFLDLEIKDSNNNIIKLHEENISLWQMKKKLMTLLK